MKPSDIQKLTQSIEGYLSQNGKSEFEGEVLYHLALKSRGKIVEIGSWKGKSTIWLGKGAEAGSRQSIYSIYPNADIEEHRSDGKTMWTFDVFKENISHADVAQYVVPVVKPPLESLIDVPGRIGMIFIDGTHDYEDIKQEFTAWLPKVQIGGIMAFHDSFGDGVPGVRRLVHEEVFRSLNFKDVRYINGITYATKVAQANFSDRLKNRAALLVKILHEKSHAFPQPFRSLIKRLIWGPCQKRWLRELNKTK